MLDWIQTRPIVKDLLENERNSNSGNYNGERCFLTAYQIAILVDKENPDVRGKLPIGGKGVGPDSFSRQIAWHLSQEIDGEYFEGKLEIGFFSQSGLEDFTFDGGHQPSLNEFSMFRLREI